MWIFTRDGFFSAVRDKDDARYLTVRGRVRDDLERLGNSLNIKLDIIEGGGTDYGFRAKVSKSDFDTYVGNEIYDIDYVTGVKDQIDLKEPARHSALYKVWSAMMGLQESKSTYTGFGKSLGELAGSPWFDDYARFDDEPFNFDPDDVIDVVPGEEGYEVRLYKADTQSIVVNSFELEGDANELASDIRDVISTWQGESYDDDDFDPEIEDDDIDESRAVTVKASTVADAIKAIAKGIE